MTATFTSRERQLEAPEVLVLDVGENLRERLLAVEVAPGEHRPRVLEVEVEHVALAAQVVAERGVRLEAIAGGHVVVEDHDALGDAGEGAQRRVPRRHVHERHGGAAELRHAQLLVVAAGLVAGRFAPGAAHRPGGPEAVGAAGVR